MWILVIPESYLIQLICENFLFSHWDFEVVTTVQQRLYDSLFNLHSKLFLSSLAKSYSYTISFYCGYKYKVYPLRRTGKIKIEWKGKSRLPTVITLWIPVGMRGDNVFRWIEKHRRETYQWPMKQVLLLINGHQYKILKNYNNHSFIDLEYYETQELPINHLGYSLSAFWKRYIIFSISKGAFYIK